MNYTRKYKRIVWSDEPSKWYPFGVLDPQNVIDRAIVNAWNKGAGMTDQELTEWGIELMESPTGEQIIEEYEAEPDGIKSSLSSIIHDDLNEQQVAWILEFLSEL